MTLLNPESDITFEDKNIVNAADRLVNYGEPDLCRLHGLDLKNSLKKQGFNVEVLDYRTSFTEEEQLKFSLGDGAREKIFICKKD